MKTIVERENKNGTIEFFEYATEEEAKRHAHLMRSQGVYAWTCDESRVMEVFESAH